MLRSPFRIAVMMRFGRHTQPPAKLGPRWIPSSFELFGKMFPRGESRCAP